jgi:hypothetical protein
VESGKITKLATSSQDKREYNVHPADSAAPDFHIAQVNKPKHHSGARDPFRFLTQVILLDIRMQQTQ